MRITLRTLKFLGNSLPILCLVVLSCSTLVHSQISQVNGTIAGVITDPAGGPVSSATIIATGTDTGFKRQAQSNERGEYSVPLLPLGQYRIDVDASGFAHYEQIGIEVRLDASSQTNVALQLGSSTQTVSVQSDATVLNTETFNVGGTMNARSLENMPLTSRNTFNLALFAPGFNGTRDNEFGNPTFAFGGMQRRGFIVDGIDNTQRGGPGRLGIFSPETIAEVKVLANDMDAEYGRTVGGIISMVTKGGTNTVHGEGLVLERRPGLISRPSLAAPPKPFQQWATFSANVGGPIFKDKLFYFASAEYEPLDGAIPITISRANATALRLPASELGTAPFKQRFQTYLGRIDYQHDPNNNFYFRYSEFQTPSQFNTSGGLRQLSASNNFNDFNQTASAQWTSIVSPRALNELRFGYLQRTFDRPPVSGAVNPVVLITGVAQLGSDASAAQGYSETQFNFIDNFSYTFRNHNFKVGTDIDTIRVDSIDRLQFQFTFANLTQYLNTINGVPGANYTQLQQQFGNNVTGHRTNPINFFGEDHWRISPTFSLSYGLRWEYRVFPDLNGNAPLAISRSIRSDPANFAPRFGFSWQPMSKMVVRGGYGIFYDTLNLRNISLVNRSNGSQVTSYVINGNVAGAPLYPNGFSGPLANFAVKPSVYGFSPNFKTQSAQQANIQAEQEIAKDFAVTVGVQWYGGHHEPVLIDTNLGTPLRTLADGRPVFSSTNRPNGSFNQIFQLDPAANSVYYGGFLSLTKRFSHSFQFVTSYTFGWAFNSNDAVGDNGSNIINPTNLRGDWAFSSSDQRHRFVLQGVWQPRLKLTGWQAYLVNGWTVAPNVTLTTGFPYTPTAGSDLNGDGVNNDYPLYAHRNDYRGPGFKEINLRLSRGFPIYRERVSLEVIGEAENLFNSTNASCTAGGCGGAINSTYGPTLLAPPTNVNFGQITSAFNARQIQLGGRLRF